MLNDKFMLLGDDAILLFLKSFSVPFEENTILSEKTWIKRGGKCRFFIMPKDTEQMKTVVKFLAQNKISYHVVGATSNLYFTNACNLRVVISTLSVSQMEYFDDYVICGCGVNVTKFARKMVKSGYAGYEGLVGLPGTIGGAVANNSSAFGYSICQMAEEIFCVDELGEEVIVTPNDLMLREHSSAIKDKEVCYVVIGVKLTIKKDSTVDLEKLAEKYQKRRSELQCEVAMTLGSCFSHLSRTIPLTILLTIRYLTRKLIRIFCSKEVQEKHYERNLFYTLSGYRHLTRYVDLVQPNCFVWRDEKADDVFWGQYLPFMKKYYGAQNLEIEIISDNETYPSDITRVDTK